MTSFDFASADGTQIRGWRNEQAGTPVVIANGLGSIPEAFPFLMAPHSGYDAVTWYHRGTFGSERPADQKAIRIEDHVADMLALMDCQGVEKALVVSWSLGVNVAFEFALEHPERVLGILGIAGVPGGTFASMGGPLRIPRPMRHGVATRAARVGRLMGPALSRVAPVIPVNRRTAWLVAHTGFMTPAAKPDVVVPMLRMFLQHDWQWYAELALAAAEHPAMDLSFVTCPVTLVGGQHDVLTSMHDVVACAGAIPHANVTVLPGSHFLPLEYPGLLHDALDELSGRSSARMEA
ncbi:MAG: Alpha/beta hydrolase fold precursor [Frankiales bacterium]|nr:Alpha/beta hydrolase fold precursor [Frankiales bacterium]